MANFNIKPNSYIPSKPVKAPRSDPPPELSLAGRADHKPFLFGICIASCMAEAVTFPIDTLKTRLQLPGMLVENYLNYYRLQLKKVKHYLALKIQSTGKKSKKTKRLLSYRKTRKMKKTFKVWQ